MLADGDAKTAGSREALAAAVAAARSSLQALIARDDEAGLGAGTAEALASAEQVLGELDAGLAEAPAADAPAGLALVFDVSDLLGYFQNNRLPTGIQRSQAELISNLLRNAGGNACQLCCWNDQRDEWQHVPHASFLRLCDLSVSGGDTRAGDWLAELERMRAALTRTSAFIFPRGAYLINLGTSWWLPNYFMYVRRAKLDAGVRYIPLVYDLIPAVTPEYCAKDLVEEFIAWFLNVLDHADFFIVISEATKRDLIRLAADVGHTVDPAKMAVMPLDGDFRKPVTRRAGQNALAKRGLEREPFVLLVSTVEARKNQLGAIDAWQKLIQAHGPGRVPKLVLVGKIGYRGDLVQQRIAANAELARHVILLSGVSDEELEALYRNCLFTLYPSFYEGWGMPVTESLCYGKVPLCSNVSSIPEAGGSWAVFFDNGSIPSMVAGLEKMIFDSAFRAQRERHIADTFSVRTWLDAARQVEGEIERWHAADDRRATWSPPVAERGYYYPFAFLTEVELWNGMGTAEAFRAGTGWGRLDDFGCWTLAGGGELALTVAGDAPMRIAFALQGLPTRRTEFTIRAADPDVSVVGTIEGGRARKWAFLDLPGGLAGRSLRLTLRTHDAETFGFRHGGAERIVGVGVEGFYVLDGDDPAARLDFLEAVALGGLAERNFYRRNYVAAAQARG